MRNIKLGLSVVCIILLFSQCNKDEVVIEKQSFSELPAYQNVDFFFIIMDKENEPLENATLTLNKTGETFTTNDKGVIDLKNLEVDRQGLAYTVSKPGYIKQIGLLRGLENSENIRKVNLIKEQPPMLIQRNVPTMLEGNVEITLPNNIVTAGNQVYNGDIYLSSQYYDPDEAGFLQSAPGELLAVDENNNLVNLVSYGMLYVEMRDANGNELQIGEGAEAEVRFPVPTTYKDIPNTIPLWSLNENTGLWSPEGNAILEGDVFVAKLSHFSYWNIDVDFEGVEICLTLRDGNGEILSNVDYIISSEDLSVIYFLGRTNKFGKTIAFVPIGKPITIRIVFKDILLSEPVSIPIQTSNGNIGDVIIPDLASIKIEAKIINCNSEPIKTGYVYYHSSTYSNFATSNNMGEVSFLVYDKMPVDIILWDFGQAVNETISLTEFSDTGNDLGDITLCLDQVAPPIRVIEQNISISQTFYNDSIYVMKGSIDVLSGAVLTIEKGTIIKFLNTENTTAVLNILKGAKIIADGTAEMPIIFTSFFDSITKVTDIPVPSELGWGGIRIYGDAPKEFHSNNPAISGPLKDHGGMNSGDNSGVLNYISVRNVFQIQGVSETVAGLHLAAVGSGTQISNIELIGPESQNHDAEPIGLYISGGHVNISNTINLGYYCFDVYIENNTKGKIKNIVVEGGEFILNGAREEIPNEFHIENLGSRDGVALELYGKFQMELENLFINYHFNLGLSGEVTSNAWINQELSIKNIQLKDMASTPGVISSSSSDPFEVVPLDLRNVSTFENLPDLNGIFGWTQYAKEAKLEIFN